MKLQKKITLLQSNSFKYKTVNIKETNSTRTEIGTTSAGYDNSKSLSSSEAALKEDLVSCNNAWMDYDLMCIRVNGTARKKYHLVSFIGIDIGDGYHVDNTGHKLVICASENNLGHIDYLALDISHVRFADNKCSLSLVYNLGNNNQKILTTSILSYYSIQYINFRIEVTKENNIITIKFFQVQNSKYQRDKLY